MNLLGGGKPGMQQSTEESNPKWDGQLSIPHIRPELHSLSLSQPYNFDAYFYNYYDVDNYFQAGTTLRNDHRSLHRPQQVQRTQC